MPNMVFMQEASAHLRPLATIVGFGATSVVQTLFVSLRAVS